MDGPGTSTSRQVVLKQQQYLFEQNSGGIHDANAEKVTVAKIQGEGMLTVMASIMMTSTIMNC